MFADQNRWSTQVAMAGRRRRLLSGLLATAAMSALLSICTPVRRGGDGVGAWRPSPHTAFSLPPMRRGRGGLGGRTGGVRGWCKKPDQRAKQQTHQYHGYSRLQGVKIFPASRKFPRCGRDDEISIATFNILQKNFNFSKKPWVLPEHATWEHRLNLLQGVLKDLNTDIICLQEVDVETFESDFADYMSDLGYDIVPPSTKNLRDSNHGHTKPSVFFKREKFTLHWHNPRSRTTLIALEIKNSAPQMRGGAALGAAADPVLLPPADDKPGLDPDPSDGGTEALGDSDDEDRQSDAESGSATAPGAKSAVQNEPCPQYGQMVYVANCHLQCGGSAGGVNVHHTRTLQMRSALRRMRWHMIRHNIDINKVALLVCGDFNCPPTDPVCQLLTRGYNTPAEVEQYFKGNDLAFENEIAMADSHKFLRDTRKRFPTFVRRSPNKGNNSIGLTMDYIFYSPNTMKLQAIRDPFTRSQKAQLRSSGLFPNHWHPSDHLPLAAKFRFEEVKTPAEPIQAVTNPEPTTKDIPAGSRNQLADLNDVVKKLDEVQMSMNEVMERMMSIQSELRGAKEVIDSHLEAKQLAIDKVTAAAAAVTGLSTEILNLDAPEVRSIESDGSPQREKESPENRTEERKLVNTPKKKRLRRNGQRISGKSDTGVAAPTVPITAFMGNSRVSVTSTASVIQGSKYDTKDPFVSRKAMRAVVAATSTGEDQKASKLLSDDTIKQQPQNTADDFTGNSVDSNAQSSDSAESKWLPKMRPADTDDAQLPVKNPPLANGTNRGIIELGGYM